MKPIRVVTGIILCVLAGVFGALSRHPAPPNTVHADEARAKWIKMETALTVFHVESPAQNWGTASAQGFWQSTSASKDKQLVFPYAVKISCDRGEKICRETYATVQLGVLNADSNDYEVSSWNEKGVIADDTDEGECGIAHRLSIDFKSNSVTVTDYPKKINTSKTCKVFQDANSYALHGGQLMLYPPAPWDPLGKLDGK